ncbi:SymE family type I addiction module toxin [Thalassomonas haliotis]|uniref:Type I addiction module toxin, SymE family n=1 Tax=Thalassomonas haliotis TaxID=485448 RepID=A0ABY7VL69_9GAMM|nr:SymE family type I addiction module toxin [Thalassomonas haliotis]WDE13811.1 type I addiction module toxin, SymE family [Thalassomonas haliotis]
MAKCHHTTELGSAKVKYPIYRQLTVLETVFESAAKTRGIGINYVPVNLEPCIVLRGKWLRQAGFTVGQKLSIKVNQEEIHIIPKLIGLAQTAKG